MTIRNFSPLTRRIITVNILPLAILLAGILYLDEYREGLIKAELDALQRQSEIFAGALGEGAIGTESDGEQFIRPSIAGTMLRPMLTTGHTRARVYRSRGKKSTDDKFLKISDTRVLAGDGGKRIVEIQALVPNKNYDFSTAPKNYKNHRINRSWGAHVPFVNNKTLGTLFASTAQLNIIKIKFAGPTAQGVLDHLHNPCFN